MLAFHLVMLGLVVVFLVCLGVSIGKAVENKHIQKKFTKYGSTATFTHEEVCASIKKDAEYRSVGDTIFPCIFILCMFVTLFATSYDGLKDYYCKRFEDGKIVRETSYRYQTINGEQVLKDSTIYYASPKKP